MKLFFDTETGQLVRSVRFVTTIIGTVPIQTDYEEYKEVAGVQVPVKLTVTWTSGQAKIELTDVQANVAAEPVSVESTVGLVRYGAAASADTYT